MSDHNEAAFSGILDKTKRANLRTQRAKRKRIVALAAVAVFVILLGFGMYRIIAINMTYPSQKIFMFSMNQEIISGNVGVTVTNLSVYEGKEIYTVVPDYEDYMLGPDNKPLPIEKRRMLVFDVVFVNYGDTPVSLHLTDFKAQIGNIWYSSLSRWAFEPLNDGMSPTIAPGEQLSVSMPYVMFFHYMILDMEIWENVMNKPVDLVMSIYPSIIIVRLSESDM